MSTSPHTIDDVRRAVAADPNARMLHRALEHERYDALDPAFVANEYLIRNSSGTGVRYENPGMVLRAGTERDGATVYDFDVTTESLDRVNEYFSINGAELGNYRANPVVLFMHNQGGMFGKATGLDAIPIGKNVDLKVDPVKRSLVGSTIFHEITEISRQIKLLVDTKYLNAVSIGAMIKDWLDRPVREGEAVPNPFISTVRGYTQWEMFEYSVVDVPMNPVALQRDRANESTIENAIRRAVTDGVIPSDAEVAKVLGRATGERIEVRTDAQTIERTAPAVGATEIERVFLKVSQAMGEALEDVAIAQKAGDALNKKNRQSLRDAKSALKSAAEKIDEVLSTARASDEGGGQGEPDEEKAAESKPLTAAELRQHQQQPQTGERHYDPAPATADELRKFAQKPKPVEAAALRALIQS